MDFTSLLDNILLSDYIVNEFKSEYNNNIEFRLWLLGILPEIEDCEKQKQDNPWHIYNVLDHILHSVEAMNTLSKDLDYTTRRMLSYTMLFHDIGKPKCHITREKDGKVIDSFFNHNIESSLVATRALQQLNFDNNQIKIISKLTYMHDIFMFIKLKDYGNKYWKVLTPKVVLENIEELNKVGDGEILIKYLVMVGRADNLSQNPKMTNESLKLLDEFERLIDSKNIN